MKKIFARIGMYLTVTDEEYEEIKNDCGHEEDLSVELAQRFVAQNELSVPLPGWAESYIPDSVFEYPEDYEI